MKDASLYSRFFVTKVLDDFADAQDKDIKTAK
jgi:hypothetical protein